MAAAPVVVLGPTASGKSDVAMAAARAVAGTEIVAVDAMQVYRGMDIGTAKPSPADRRAVRHHGIDLVDPDVDFTVADYRRGYDGWIAGIAGHPLLVAGTGLYLNAVIDRLDAAGTVAGRARRAASRRHRRPVAPAHRARPCGRRPASTRPTAAASCGRSRSRSAAGARSARTARVSQAYPPTDAVLLGLRWPRDVLADRIERTGRRDDGGRAARRGRPGRRRRACRARPARRSATRSCSPTSTATASLDDAVASIVLRTRQFAVRQERWFRRDPRVRWFDIDHDPVAEVAPAVVAALHA